MTLHWLNIFFYSIYSVSEMFSFLAELDYSDDVEEVTADDIDAYDDWVHGRNNSRRSQRLSDSGADRAFSGSSTRSSSSGYQLQPHCYTAGHDLPHTPSVKVQAKESVSSLSFFCCCQVR